MKRKIPSFIADKKGSVLMEFILVVPVYLALWGGLFTIGEMLLLNNRIAVADRNMSYIVPYLLDPLFSAEQRNEIKNVIIGLSGRNISTPREADIGYARSIETYFSHGGNTDPVTETDWGYIYSTALTVNGIEFPSFIQGMLAAISILSGDSVSNNDFIYTAGALTDQQKNQEQGRHFLIFRKSNISYRNPAEKEDGSGSGDGLLKIAMGVSMENYLGNRAIDSNGSTDIGDVQQDNYTNRRYGKLFSEGSEDEGN